MIEIIPAIDIIEGQCVRLSKGDYATQKIYHKDPLAQAQQFEDHGIGRLHLVDLEGAKKSHIVNYKTLERIAAKTNLILDFGGGIKSQEDIHIAFESGAQMITGGSIAVQNPTLFASWIEKYGSERMILGADARDRKISTMGWKESSELDILDFIETWMERGITKAISTDIEKDGMLQGPSFDLYREIKDRFPELFIVASGGISNMQDILTLNEDNIDAVIVGKAIYEGHISLKTLEQFITSKQ
ncbi:1-(5-phosphoribosyl)-5-[(5-phosphoribosylamino)methylideneamino]imidazole-4-carboxamide isomerase [Halosquirtibacter xylanolyticus]|uniref:1-(5-phosphoribosyl)-5-[(5- phosphoribosylamino)methylideneamino]imidazole-4- carboxamide isomerase n=1 Tax=Halosquirtibacter xylanolyticus TaxID=3374599 RepID=UPI0037485F5C|nr:1-(5-phosphoribosyl)-5-[(5-phosphoribosylamino)methylideneamino]imidazole-4-carboxamide isomerase [Prolixibacteraceae bacterium]